MLHTNITSNQTYIAYMRVSTDRQGKSGLGMDAQKSTIDEFINKYGGNIIETYSDVISGKEEFRPGLNSAILHARLSSCIILVSKLDRLTRSVWLLSHLSRENIPFVVAESPFLDNFQLTLYSSLAEKEVELIASRTRDALKQAKKRGVILGSPVLPLIRCDDVSAANDKRSDMQKVFRQRILLVIEQIESAGKSTCQDIATELNRRSLTTYFGKGFSIATVSRLRRGR